ncbi:MAG: 2-oxoglutarate dehydrogenase complex dihydrolipoyllysine-residue succinyltransferase [Planctomycetota bacterium]
MSTEIVVPTIGESITEGVIAAWLKQPGDWVEQDETVLELETDKITMEIPAPAAGVLEAHAAAEGDTVEVGAVLGQLNESAEKPVDKPAEEPAEKPAAKPEPEPAAAAKTDAAQAKPSPPASGSSPAAASNGTTNAPSASDRGLAAATSLAKKLADEHGVDLTAVTGTGAGGRVREQDILAAVQAGHNGQGGGGTNGVAAGPSRAVSVQRMTPLRQRVATRLVEAQQTAAMLTTFNECDMSAVMALRKRHKEAFAETHGINLGFMSFFVKAVVRGLRAQPDVNASIVEDDAGKPAIRSHEYCDIAIAVASPKGLVVPVLRNAESLSFAEIESGIKDLAVRARDGKITLDEMSGGTFTITNGGIFGSLMSTPILNPPQSGILGMHAIKNRAVEDPANPGQAVIRPMMYLALSYDHRIVDGAGAVKFLVAIKDAIEDPERLMLEI